MNILKEEKDLSKTQHNDDQDYIEDLELKCETYKIENS